jgi:hypothetical protein
MTSVVSIGELQRKPSLFSSQKKFIVRNKKKNKNTSIVLPYEGEDSAELMNELEKVLQNFSPQKPKKRVFPTPFKDNPMTESDWDKFWEADKEIENEMLNSPIFPE